MTIIYNYNESGFFVGHSVCDKCQITGVDLIPANATTIEPPVVELPSLPIFNGEKWLVFTPESHEKTIEQLIDEQCSAIDAHINKTIKKFADFDNITDVSLCLNSTIDRWVIEAKQALVWIEQCYIFQEKIKNGLLVFESVDYAIAALPIFEATSRPISFSLESVF